MKASCWPPFKSFLRGVPSFYFWWGSSSEISTISFAGWDEHTAQSDEWCHYWIPKEGPGAARIVGQEIKEVGFSVAVDPWGGMDRRVARDMFPISNWRGHISTLGLLGGKPAGPSNRWLERIGGLSPPPLWPPFLDIAFVAMKLLDDVGIIHTMGLCLSDVSGTAAFHLHDSCGTVGLCLPK